MREYEVVYIFRSALAGDEIDSHLERHHNRLVSADGGEITAVEHWGKRQLAYSINGHDNGYYVVAQFRVDPGSLPEFERGLKLDDDLLRHLIVLSEGELPTPPSQRGVGAGDDDGRDEGDEDEDEDEDEE